ncbi:acyltransferase [Dyadobacter sp. CY323]|nr:acyltransferase [Dyadobacter sp. CY323]
MQPQGIKLFFRTSKEQRCYVTVGENCIINADFIFESERGEVQIGNNVQIGSANFICRNGITIGNDVTMAWGITIYDHDSHSVNWEERQNDNTQCYKDFIEHTGNMIVNKDWSKVKSRPISIQDKVWIGFDATILKGVTIGEGAVVGAKSVVTKDVPPWSVVAGNPAKVVKYTRDNI